MSSTAEMLLEKISAAMRHATEEAIKQKAPRDKLQATIFAAGLRELTASVAALTDRLEAIESAPMVYDGPYESGKTYSKGTFVTRDGSLWHCNEKTTAQPGDGRAWTLAVKRGKDGKDWNAR